MATAEHLSMRQVVSSLSDRYVLRADSPKFMISVNILLALLLSDFPQSPEPASPPDQGSNGQNISSGRVKHGQNLATGAAVVNIVIMCHWKLIIFEQTAKNMKTFSCSD